ncbi:MAG: hypothetical protein P8Q97_09820 [Myxococcota bacterium]|jgi:hypothetical protein|nr:hypothetical protein [Myxococcota bacterium]
MLKHPLAALPWLTLFLLGGCIINEPDFEILVPEQGQLIRNLDKFEVQLKISEEAYDLGSVTAFVNGVPLELLASPGGYVGILPAGLGLEPGNQLIVSATRLSDGTPRARMVEFSWEPLAPNLQFRDEFVEDPPPVETANLEILHTAGRRQNALLEVTFREGFSAPKQIPYRADEQTVFILSDNGMGDDPFAGDGVFTARVDFDFENYRERKSRDLLTLALREEVPDELIFSGREIVTKKELAFGPALAALSSPTSVTLVPAAAAAATLDPERALMVRNLSVVADPSRTFDPCDIDGDGLTGNPNGAWSFKTLMGQMANTTATGIPLEVFVKQWLAGWAQNFDTVNGGSLGGDWIVNDDVVPDREPGLISSILTPWPKTSAGTLDMDQAPFRLLAIVNRVDLRDAVGYGASTASAGELRFVFGLLDMNSCTPDRMSAIFEYTVQANTCNDVINYAQEWEDLDLVHPPFPATPGYLSHLQSITDPVVAAGAAPSEPNGSSIGQLRTSEIAMGNPWELREFTLQQMPLGLPVQNVLRMDTTKQTPDIDFTLDPGMQPTLENYINSNLADICNQEHVVPDTWMGAPFMAGRADFFPNTHFWAPGIMGSAACTNDDIRFKFSVNTCSGCHGADAIDPAIDPPFYHVDPTSPPGTPVALSRFLTGTGSSSIPDPSPIGGVGRDFADLDRRATDLQDLLATGCLGLALTADSMAGAVH